jgi:hypothetical protein
MGAAPPVGGTRIFLESQEIVGAKRAVSSASCVSPPRRVRAAGAEDRR